MIIEQVYKNKNYKSRINGEHTIQYNTWIAMKQRCSSDQFQKDNLTYKECKICDAWLDFQIFSKWFDENYIQGYQLDKDLLIPGNKLYSPNTCCFIPQEINIAIIKPSKKRDLPIGVHKHGNKFVAHIKENKKSKYLGIFVTEEEAFNCYSICKKQQLRNLAIKYRGNISSRTYRALINYNLTTKTN